MTMNKTNQWALEQAIRVGANPDTLLELSQEIALFIKDDQIKQQNKKTKPKAHKRKLRLSKRQHDVLRVMQDMEIRADIINATNIGNRMGVSQSYISAILRKLTAHGLVEREGYSYWLAPNYQYKLL